MLIFALFSPFLFFDKYNLLIQFFILGKSHVYLYLHNDILYLQAATMQAELREVPDLTSIISCNSVLYLVCKMAN